MNVSDSDLLILLAKGDNKAIKVIYSTMYPTIEKMVFKLGGNREDAYDVFQDAVTILFEKAKSGSLELSCKLSTYVTAVAKNIWTNKQLEKKRLFVANYEIDEDALHLDISNDIQTFNILELHSKSLLQSLKKLGEPCTKLINSFYIQHKTMQWIADTFGYTNAENAKSQKYKCLNRLRKIFFDEKQNLEEYERSY